MNYSLEFAISGIAICLSMYSLWTCWNTQAVVEKNVEVSLKDFRAVLKIVQDLERKEKDRKDAEWDKEYEAECDRYRAHWCEIEKHMDNGLNLEQAAAKVGYTLKAAKRLKHNLEASII